MRRRRYGNSIFYQLSSSTTFCLYLDEPSVGTTPGYGTPASGGRPGWFPITIKAEIHPADLEIDSRWSFPNGSSPFPTSNPAPSQLPLLPHNHGHRYTNMVQLRELRQPHRLGNRVVRESWHWGPGLMHRAILTNTAPNSQRSSSLRRSNEVHDRKSFELSCMTPMLRLPSPPHRSQILMLHSPHSGRFYRRMKVKPVRSLDLPLRR